MVFCFLLFCFCFVDVVVLSRKAWLIVIRDVGGIVYVES